MTGDGRPGELCLEYGPDNWTNELSGADLLVSAHRLLVGEDRYARGPLHPVLSRHETTFGQELRSAALRFVVTPAFAVFARELASGALVPVAVRSILQRRTLTAVVEAARSADGPTWADPTVPKDIGTGWKGVIVRLSEEADEVIKARSFAELCVALCDKGIDLGSWVEAQEAFSGLIVLAAGDRFDARWRATDLSDGFFAFKTIMAPSDGDVRVSPSYEALAGKRVALVGCGSAGSKIGVSLARSGVGHFLLVDDDVLLPGNLIRNDLDWRDIGAHKADALWDRIKLVNPTATGEVRRIRLAAQEASGSAAATLSAIATCDLIVDATANATAFNLLSVVVASAARPVVWLEVFGGGYGGLVARHRPGIDLDPQSMRAGVLEWCARQGDSWPRGARDYQAERECGAPLVADDASVSVISAHATRMALDQLSDEEPSRFPHSVYLIGLSEGWIFAEPFDTRPIDVNKGANPVERRPDAAEVEAGLRFVGDLL